MPSPKTTLDLEAWNNSLPQERSNDYEYNLLLYKFRSFFNEVKDFHELHSNCSVARANYADYPFQQTVRNLSSSTLPSNDNKNITSSYLINSNGKQVFSLNKSRLQHQNSVPFSSSSPNRGTEGFLKQNDLLLYQQQNAGTSVQHYNSTYNLPTSNSSSSGQNQIGLSRPEIKQRNQMLNQRQLISKSSERLDNINNNHLPVASSLQDHSREALRSGNFYAPVARESKFLQNDSNIYDAVSPDDMPSSEISKFSVAASIHNLNRLSLPQRGKLESSKSSLGIGLGSDINRNNCDVKNIPVSNSKSTFDGNKEALKSNSFGSSIISETLNNSSSSLSQLASLPNKDHNDSLQYSNYVNIDFFLKRSNSPSFDGLEGDTTNDESSDNSDEEGTALMSQSLSSDQICDEALRGLSPTSLVKTEKGHENSSSSLTPASSGDFLDEHSVHNRLHNSISTPITTKSQKESTSSRLANFFASNNRENESPIITSKSTNFRTESSQDSPPNHALEAIHENATSFSSSKHTTSLDSSQLDKDDAMIEARNTMRTFLSDLNLSPVDDVFEDKAQRRIVKESFAVEYCGRRKLRHLFLFNDVIVCAKYQASSKQKFTFDVKWYLNLNGVSILDLSDVNNQVKFDKEAIDNQILAIRTNLMLLRGQMQHIKKSKHKQPSKIIKKLKKKRTELEAELVLLLPHLPLVIKHLNGKKYTFFLSSNFDRNQWVESIKFLQSQLPSTKGSSSSPSSNELQAWIQTCRKNLNPSLGTFLLRSNCDEDALYGDLYINLTGISGVVKTGNYYFCFEVDSYGHFSQKASSPVFQVESCNQTLNEEYVFPLDGAHTLRILQYEDLGSNSKPPVVGKAQIELSRARFFDKPVEKIIPFSSNCSLITKLSYSSTELLSMRVPHTKLCPTFGTDITQVCKKEKTHVPLLIQHCVNEVERRGMREVGIYRMSGTSTDIQRLKKAFESNPYVAEILLRDIDINSVTGFLKTYLREMPEGLFSNKLYLKFVAAFKIPQSESLERTKKMLELFHKIPIINQHTIIYLVEHLVKVNKYESYNKMSLTNLATVLGPNILRPPTNPTELSSSDPFTAVVIGSMSQAGILYFFLNRKFSNLPLTELDSSELIHPLEG